MGTQADEIEALKRRLDGAGDDAPPEAAAALHHRLGVLHLSAGRVAEALDQLDLALLGAPANRATLLVLTDAYERARRAGRWSDAAAFLERLIEHAEGPARLARLHHAMAVLRRDCLGDPRSAVQSFEACLEHDPTHLRAFEAMDRILTAHKAWDRLEAAYRLMIQRVRAGGAASPELERMLWRNLGEIYRTRLGRQKEAALAFAQASALDPGDAQLHEIVADLHVRADELDKAIRQHHAIIKLEPTRLGSYRALVDLYRRTGDADAAWNICGALVVLRQADANERATWEAHRAAAAPQADTVIDHDLWSRAVVHPLDNLRIGNVFAKLVDLNPYATTFAALGLTKADRLDLAAPTDFARAYHYACRTLQLGDYAPEVYLRSARQSGLSNGNTIPWSLVVGPDVLAAAGAVDSAFLLGRQLCLYRLEHYMAGLCLPSGNLKLLFFAAWRVTAPTAPTPEVGDTAAMDEMVSYLAENIAGTYLVDLYETIEQLVSGTPDINLSSWVRGVEHTANRAGLLLCGDVEIAARLVKGEPHPVSKADAKERVKELLLYAVSPEHFRARRELGLARRADPKL